MALSFTTTTEADTLKKALNQANPQLIADALAAIDLGSILEAVVFDTGTITASATITLNPPALVVQSARVVTSGTAGSVGSYLVADAGATAVVPAAANTQPGVAPLSADGTTITFPNTVTRVVVQYIRRPAVALSTLFPAAPTV